MAFCGKCGTKINENEKFCPSCGAPTGNSSATGGGTSGFEDGLNKATEGLGNAFNKFNNAEDQTSSYDAKDINDNKMLAWIAYIGPLFLIPLFVAKDSKYARFHAIQGATMCALWVVYSIVSILLNLIRIPRYTFGIYYGSYTPWFVSLIVWLLGIGVMVFAIIGIVNAATGKAKELPLIGKIKFFK